jgi:hypothetical protein
MVSLFNIDAAPIGYLMEKQRFIEIQQQLSLTNPDIVLGKMMSAKAIVYRSKVLAFLSVNHKMVFKLGKNFDPQSVDFEINVFNPYTKRAPFNGWFEVPYKHQDHWMPLAQKALALLQVELVPQDC